MVKWTSVAWALGTAGFLGAMGLVVDHGLVTRTIAVEHGTTPHIGRPKEKAASKNQDVPHFAANASVPRLAPFNGQAVTETNPDLTPVILPRDYPIAVNPVEFYTPGDFTLVQSLTGTLNGSVFAVQVYASTMSSVIAVVIGENGTPVSTQLFGGAIKIAALTKNSVLVEATPLEASPAWYLFNLKTGAIMGQTFAAPGLKPQDPYIQGIPPGILQETLTPNTPIAGTTASANGQNLKSLLLYEANTMLLTAISPDEVMVSQPSSTTTVLSALEPSRWQSVDFQYSNGQWIPTAIHTTVDNLSLTYNVTQDSVVLPYSEMVLLQKTIASQPYTALDSQTGALARLPINLAGASVADGANTPKINLIDQGHSILALTYPTTAFGQTYYAPIGWYWWKGAPGFLTPNLPNSSGSPSGS